MAHLKPYPGSTRGGRQALHGEAIRGVGRSACRQGRTAILGTIVPGGEGGEEAALSLSNVSRQGLLAEAVSAACGFVKAQLLLCACIACAHFYIFHAHGIRADPVCIVLVDRTSKV